MNKKYVVTTEFMSDGQHEDTEISVFHNLINAQEHYELRIAQEMESEWYKFRENQKSLKINEGFDKIQENLEWEAFCALDDWLIIRLTTVIENQEV